MARTRDLDDPSDSRLLSRAPLPNPIARALALQVGKLEKLRLRAWQALATATVLAALSLALASGRAGFGAAGVGLAALAWFTIASALLARQKYGTFAAFVTFLVEQTMPWAIFVAVFERSGAEEATRVWGPPLAYTGMLILTTLKLSPRYSIITGVLGGVQYLALSLWLVRPALDRLPEPINVETVAAGGELVRATMLVIGGFVVAVVAQGLRSAVGAVVSTLRAADLFGKYRLERELASGGMGVVWLSTYCPEGGFQRSAAVKLVHPHLAKDRTFVDAFRNEAELCARLVHQNIVQVFDFGRIDDRYFLAMEFVDGLTLRDVMKRAAFNKRAIPPVVVGAVVRQILSGLHFAHVDAHDSEGKQLRVIHRDLAPSNILVSRGGEVKLTDFGIARALRDSVSAQTQTVAGHFNYMAPEQTSAGALDERTDLFCVGIILWEMLVGKPLFKRDSDAATLFAVNGAPILMPSSLGPDYAHLAPFDDVIRRALARKPSERFESARAMQHAVREAAGVAAADSITAFISSLPPPVPKTGKASLKPPATPLTDSQPVTGLVDRDAPSSSPSSPSSPASPSASLQDASDVAVTLNAKPAPAPPPERAEVTATIVDPPKDELGRDTTLMDKS